MSCSIIRNKETNEVEKVLAPNGNESLLYKKLLDTPEINGNKELALHAWAYTYTDSFKNSFDETSDKLDENGEPLLEEDTIESMYNDLVNNSDFGEVIEEQDDTTEPELKLSEQIEAEKEPLDVRIQRFLESIGVDVKAVDEIRDSQGNLISASAKADLLNKVIEVVSGRQSMDTLSEEAAHFFVEMLGENNPLYKELFSKITNYKIYQDVVTKYKNLARYRKADGTVNFDKLKKEAIAKVISEHIFKLQQGEESDSTMSSLLNWWNKVWDYVKSFFINTEEDPFETSAEKILNADITGLNTEERFDEEYYQLVDPVAGVKEDQKNIKLDNSVDPRTRQKRHIYTYKGDTARGSVTSYYVDKWLRKIFRSDQRSELQKLIDLSKAEYGDVIHDQIQDIVKSWTDANGIKLDVQSPISPKIDSKVYNTLNKFVQSVMNQYEPGTIFMSEVKIYDQKTKIAGSIDLLVIQPNDVVDIYDWKSQEIGKTQTDIKTYKETMYRIQLENYRKILQLQYGFEKFGKIRAIPMKTTFTYKDGLPDDIRDLEVGNIDPLLIPDEKNYLLPVTLRGETTGDEQLDELIEKLNGIYDKIEKTRYTKEQIFKKREELGQIRIALRELQLKQRVGKLIDLGLVEYKKYSEMIGNNTLAGKDIQEALRILQVFQDSGVMLYDLREQYAEVLKQKKDDKALAAYEAVNKKFQSMTSKVSKLIKDIEKYRDIQTEDLGKKNGIVNVMQAEAPVNRARGTFSSLSNIPQKMFKLFSKLLRRVQNIRDSKFDQTVRDLKTAKKNFITWASSKGLTVEKAIEKILDIDEKGNWNGNFLRKYKPEFTKERKEAIDKQNLQWFADNTDYDPDEYAEAEKKERESISSVVYAADEKENTELLNKKMKQWINNHKLIKDDGSINTMALANVKNRFIKPKEKWLTDKWKDLNKPDNAPLLTVYNEFQKLIRYAEDKGMLDQYSPNFIPSTYKGKIDQLAFGDIKGLFSAKGFFENLQVDSGTTYTPEIDPTDGSIINRIPVYFTKDIGVKKEDETMDYSKKSRDLFKVFAIWAAHVYNYEAMASIEDDSLMMLEAEKNKKSLVTDNFGKIALDDNGRVKAIDKNDKNADLLEKFINYYLYDRINGKFSDIKIYNPFNKDLENRKEISVVKSLSAAIRFFSLKTLALNPISGTSQFVGGTGNALFIAQKGILFTKKLWANAMYKVASDKKSRAALVYLNILQEGNKHKMIDELSLSSVNNLLKEDNLFAIQRVADKGVQYPIAIAMMMDHMVNEDGKIVSIQKTVKDEFNYNANFYNLSKAERKETMAKMEARIKELQTKNLLEIGTLDDEGHFSIPGVEKSSDTMGEFRDKIKAANKKIIGNSSREDISNIRTTMLGQSLMQFRNWMPEMIEERIAGLDYDEELQTWTYGKFNSFFKDLLSTKLPKLLKAVATGYGDNAIELAKMRYQEMKRSALEKGEEFTITEGEFIDLYIGNLKSMITEILVLTGFATAVFSVVSGAGEDRRKSGYKQYLVRALKKYYNEFSFYYLPTELTKLVKSPIPVVGLAEDMFRFTGNLTKEIAGQLSGNEKWIKSAHPEKYFFRMVPVAKEAMTLGAAFDDDFRKDWDINLQTGGF